jgi:putative protease
LINGEIQKKEVDMQEKEIGTVTHYYGHLSVGIIELQDALKIGDTVHIKGHTDDFTETVESMQIEHANVTEAKAGDSIGIKVTQKVHPHDKVYKVIA